MTFRRLLLSLVAFSAALAAPAAEVHSQNGGAAAAQSVTRAVEEAEQTGLPGTTINRLLALGYDNGVAPKAMSALLRVMDEVKKDDLPVEPFLDKIVEGMAKHAEAASIEQVLNQKKQDYEFTRAILSDYLRKHDIQQQVTSEDLTGIAEGLYSGLSREDLARTVEHAPAVSLFALKRVVNVQASLKQAGFDREQSDRIVGSALEHNFFTRQRRGFARSIVAGKHRGLSDKEITEAALVTIRSGGTVAEFCSRIGVSSPDMEANSAR